MSVNEISQQMQLEPNEVELGNIVRQREYVNINVMSDIDGTPQLIHVNRV
jgi:hypothetical protein